MPQFENYAPYTAGVEAAEAVNELFRKVYQFMAMGLILTALSAYMTASSPFMVDMLYGSRVPMLVIAVAEIALVLWLSAGLNRLSAEGARNIFFVYSVLNGMLCSSVLLVYTGASVWGAFVSTAGMFWAMSVWGLTTKRDLSGWGSMLRMGLIGLLIALVVNVIVGSTLMELTTSVMGVIIFMGLTAYDTMKLRALAESSGGGGAEVGKVAVMGALMLYLDFVNIFLYLLRLFGRQRD